MGRADWLLAIFTGHIEMEASRNATICDAIRTAKRRPPGPENTDLRGHRALRSAGSAGKTGCADMHVRYVGT